MNARSEQILKILVERYIEEGAPVGSKTIANDYSLALSSATIRNILADLETLGFLASPHTSAGRIPTLKGYRYFVDCLLTVKSLEKIALEALKDELNPDLTMPNLLLKAASLMSQLTKMTGIVSLPKRNVFELRQVEFLSLSTNRVLVIIVFNNHEVQNRVIYTDRIYSKSELTQIANYLNTHYIGKDLNSIQNNLSKAIKEDQEHINNLLKAAVDVANKAFTSLNEQHQYVITGQEHLLNYYEEVNLAKLKNLFDAMNQKQEILDLLQATVAAEGLQIFIGKESGHQIFDDFSMVASCYLHEGEVIGSLGVIGPTRMPYDKVISAVDVTAKLLSLSLESR